jgi:hypothetical protein
LEKLSFRKSKEGPTRLILFFTVILGTNLWLNKVARERKQMEEGREFDETLAILKGILDGDVVVDDDGEERKL